MTDGTAAHDTAGYTSDPGEAAASGTRYTLLAADRRPCPSSTPGRFGGHRKNKIYGRPTLTG